MRSFSSIIVILLVLLAEGYSLSEKIGRTAVYDPGNRIDFRALRVGQESRYVGWKGSGYCGQLGVSLVYTADTLVLRVVELSDGGAVIEERVTNDSSVHQ